MFQGESDISLINQATSPSLKVIQSLITYLWFSYSGLKSVRDLTVLAHALFGGKRNMRR